MRSSLAVLVSIAVALLSWGTYGPVLHLGKTSMEHSALRPFICVGVAYFLIAVIAPLVLLRLKGEPGHWSTTGIIWSLVAGGVGALGALGVILALVFHGNPVYVMPLIFGGAPVVNTLLTMFFGRSFKVNPIFLAGLIVVIVGAVTVLAFRPLSHASADAATPMNWLDLGTVFLFTAMTILCWGAYGPTLHKGQAAMAGSRMRPFLCVGLAYFGIAVVVPIMLLGLIDDPGQFTVRGTLYSLAGGAAGALGALGIIMAFNFGGKPIYVMPLVFGGAPIVNTLVSLRGNLAEAGPLFYAGLILVVAGAVTVLVFAPKAPHAPPAQPAPPAEKPKQPATA